MSAESLDPEAPSTNDGALVNGATVEAVLSDSDNTSYVNYNPAGEGSIVSFSDPASIPAGALIKGYSVVARVSAFTPQSPKLRTVLELDGVFNIVAVATPLINWASIQQVQLLYWANDDNDPTTARIYLSRVGGGALGGLQVRKLRLDVIYVPKPTVSVDAPSGDLLTDNRPVIEWTNTIDADADGGGAQALAQVHLYTAAQVAEGGFSPNTSTPLLETAYFGPATSWKVSEMLLNGDYRAYVRSGCTVNGEGLISEWDYSDFTVDVLAPGAPGLTVTPQPDYGRVMLELDDTTGDTDTDGFEVQRWDAALQEWVFIRTVDGDGRVLGTEGIVYDFEAPSDTRLFYRARAVHIFDVGEESYSLWVDAVETSLELTQWWGVSPTDPYLNVGFDLTSFDTFDREGRVTMLQALGASLPIGIFDTKGGKTGSISIRVPDDDALEKIEALTAATTPILLKCPEAYHEPDRWVVFQDDTTTRAGDKSWVDERVHTVNWAEVDAPLDKLASWPPWPPGTLPGEETLPSDTLLPEE